VIKEAWWDVKYIIRKVNCGFFPTRSLAAPKQSEAYLENFKNFRGGVLPNFNESPRCRDSGVS